MFTFEKNVVYGETEEEYLTADLYMPLKFNEPLPILVLIHGGAFQAGSKEMYKEWGENFAQEGYFVMAINYRLATPNYASFPAVIEDLKQAMNWLVLNANKKELDINKIGLIGDSAGAYLSSLFALSNHSFSYRVCSVIGVYGLYDLAYECKNPIIVRDVNMNERLLGLPFDGNESAFYAASPIAHIQDAMAVPTFDTIFYLIWGEKDTIVNPTQSLLFYEALKEVNIEVEITKVEDKGHFWFNKLPGIAGGKVNDYPNNVLMPNILDFLHRTVKQALNGHYSKRQIQILSKIGGDV
ncbi:alpha/beta hydrolase [Sporosarcina sp. FSL W7-1283]|uniref:alpha/beta hydrolase n=1 Tax=Sporosarcina sp. FSL W7-1283 TaxID=2921560 RepID=UPI0030FC4400